MTDTVIYRLMRERERERGGGSAARNHKQEIFVNSLNREAILSQVEIDVVMLSGIII
jgi:hypothetical protein